MMGVKKNFEGISLHENIRDLLYNFIGNSNIPRVEEI